MAVPSSPGWKFGYVPSPGEWNNVFAGKVDFPAPLAQGGTGGQSAPEANYNLQQRLQVVDATAVLQPLLFVSVRTDLTATTLSLPLANSCKAGDWIDVTDVGANASINNIELQATGADDILFAASSVSTLLLQANNVQCILVTDGVSSWRAVIVGASNTQPAPRQISATTYTLQLLDAGQYLQFTAASDVTVTVPTNAVVPFIIGTTIVMEQFGTGQVTVVPDTGVVVNGHNNLKTSAQYAVIQLKNGSNSSNNTWTLLGDAAP